MVAAGADIIDRLEPLDHLAETGVVSVSRAVVDACIFGASGSGKMSHVTEEERD